MKEFDTYQAEIMTVFPSAIEYGEYSDLTTDEIAALNEWLDEQPKGAIFEYAEESEFGTCDILGIMGDVVQITVSYNLHDVAA